MEKKKYDAFISYRHLPLDKAVAERLQKLLEGYRPPKGGSYEHTDRITRLFRDEAELPTSNDLGGDIRSALEQSRFLIVLISPKLKESKWCMQEIEYFRELHGGRTNRILPILIEGGPEAFPDVLRYDSQTVTMDDGTKKTVSVEVEPLAANIIASGKTETLKKLKTEFLRIAAPLLGCGFDALFGRHQRRARRRVMMMAAGVIAVASVFIGSVLIQNRMIQQERDIAVFNEQLAIRNEEEANTQRIIAEANEAEATAQRLLAEANEAEATAQRLLAEANEAEATAQRLLAEANEAEATMQRLLAEANEAEARKQEAEANAQRVIAEANRDEADAQRFLAEANEAEANMQRIIAELNEAEANTQRLLAEANEAEAVAQRLIAEANEAVATARGEEIAARQAKIYTDFSFNLIGQQNLSGAGYLAFQAHTYGGETAEVMSAMNSIAYWRGRDIGVVAPVAFRQLGIIPRTRVTFNNDVVFNHDGSTFTFVDGTFTRTYETATMRLISEHFGFPSMYTGVFDQIIGDTHYYISLGNLYPNADRTQILIPGIIPRVIDAATGEILHSGRLSAEMLTDFGMPRYFYDRAGRFIFDILTGSRTPVPVDAGANMQLESYSADGRFTALRNANDDLQRDSYVDVVNNATGEVTRLRSPNMWFRSHFFSRDSRYSVYVASGTNALMADGTRSGSSQHIMIYCWDKRDYVQDFYVTGTLPPVWDRAQTAARRRPSIYTSGGVDRTLNLEYAFSHEFYIYSDWPATVLFSPCGTKILVPYSLHERETSAGRIYRDNTSIHVLDLITGGFHDLKLPDATRISSMAWNHDGTIVYYVSNDNTAREFRLYGKTLDGVTVSESRVRSEVESFFIAPDGMTAILNVNSEGALQQALQVLTFAPGDAAVLRAQSVGRMEYLRVMYDREVDELIGLCRLHGFAYNHVVLNEFGYVQHKLGNNGTRLLYSVASLLRIYGIPEQRELFTLSLGHAVNYENRFPVGDKLIAIAAEADRFVFGHGDVITVYCATTGGVQRELTIMGSNVRNIDISPNGKRAAAITDKGTFFVFDLDTGEELTQYSLPFLAMRRPFFTPDGKYICDETTRAVFSAETGAFISAFLDVPLPYTMQPGGGTLVWLDGTYTLRIPPSDEVLETVRGVVRGYAFTQEERRAYYLE